MCKKIRTVIDLSYDIRKIMVKQHKMQIFIFDSKLSSEEVIFDHCLLPLHKNQLNFDFLCQTFLKLHGKAV